MTSSLGIRWRHGVQLLLVTCWCEAHYVWVPAEDVAAGLTKACGLTRCEATA
jgi:hypothetical protein